MTKTKPIITLQELYQQYRLSSAEGTMSGAANREQTSSLDTLLGQALSLPENEQLQFFLPELEQWGIFVASLLKFAFPPSQISHTYRRFAIQWLANSRVTKKHIHKLSWPALEWLVQQLCLKAFPASLTDMDVRLQLWWVNLDISEFQVKRLVEGDIHLFSQEDPSRLHSYYYQGQLDEKTLTHILTAHGFSRTTTGANVSWLIDYPQETQSPVLAYWLVRRLAFPLPWCALFDAFQKKPALWSTLMDNQPLLAAMADGMASLEKIPVKVESDYQTVLSGLNACQKLLADNTANGDNHLPYIDRPYQRLILVEGTTEAILIPVFAQLYCSIQADKGQGQFNWKEAQVRIQHTTVLPVGGKNQMFAMYRALANDLAIPIGILLDQDAAKTYHQLESIKRESDPLLMIEEGEMEDLYSLEILLPIINEGYHPHPALTEFLYEEIITLGHPLVSSFHGTQKPKGRVEELRLIWQVFSFGRFDKVEMAQQIALLISTQNQSAEASKLIPQALASYICRLYDLPEP